MKRILSIIALCTAMFSIISCNKENPNEPVEPKDDSYVGVTYQIKLGAGWFEFYDVNVTYIDIKGVEHNVTITQNSQYIEKIDYKSAPAKYAFKVVAKLKAGVTAESFDPDKTYDIGHSYVVSVARYAADGGIKTIYGNHSNSVSLSAKGSKAYEAMTTKYQERTFVDFTADKK